MITGIGSLPSVPPADARDFVARWCPELPFWPQDPSDPWATMIGEALLGLEAHVQPNPAGTAFDVPNPKAFVNALRDPDRLRHPLGFDRFVAFLSNGSFPHAKAVKGQLVGPTTLAACLTHRGSPLAEAAPTLVPAIGVRLSRLAMKQVGALGASGVPVQLWIDEPCLPAVAPLARVALGKIVGCTRRAGGKVGVHCCAPPPLGALLELAPDTVSFDAWQGLESVCNDPLALDLLGEVETIAWGIIPTSEDDLNSLDVPALAERWRTAVSVLGDPDAMLERSVFTPACGLGSRTLAVATLAFSTLTRFAAHPSLRAR